jgi:hypothetical protein
MKNSSLLRAHAIYDLYEKWNDEIISIIIKDNNKTIKYELNENSGLFDYVVKVTNIMWCILERPLSFDNVILSVLNKYLDSDMIIINKWDGSTHSFPLKNYADYIDNAINIKVSQVTPMLVYKGLSMDIASELSKNYGNTLFSI